MKTSSFRIEETIGQSDSGPSEPLVIEGDPYLDRSHLDSSRRARSQDLLDAFGRFVRCAISSSRDSLKRLPNFSTLLRKWVKVRLSWDAVVDPDCFELVYPSTHFRKRLAVVYQHAVSLSLS